MVSLSKDVSIQLMESSIAQRYAKAFFEIAMEQGKCDAYLEGLEAFNQIGKANPQFEPFLANRFVDIKARLLMVDEFVKKFETDELLGNFLKVVIKKGRADQLKLITEFFKKMVYQLQNKLGAVVTSAEKLDDSVYLQIQKSLVKKTKKEIVLEKKIEPEVLGGMLVQVDGAIYDGTLKTHLEKIKEKMREASF